MLSELFTAVSAKVAAASLVAATAIGTGAAAASGHLPDDLQDGIATAAESVGLDLPDTGDDVRQDTGSQDDVAVTQNGDPEERAETGDDVLTSLSGDEDTTPEDGAEFGAAVSDNAGEELGRTTASEASDGTSSDHAAIGEDAAESTATVSDEHQPENAPDDAPSDSGAEQREDGEEHATDSNPGDDHRPGS